MAPRDAPRRGGLLFEAEDGRTRFLVEPGTPPVVVGRHPPRDAHSVKLRSALASREHVRLRADGEGVIVEDAGSTGGVDLDGARLRGPTPIGPGVRLQLTGADVFTTRAFHGASLYDLVTARDAPGCTPLEAAAMVRDLLRALGPLHALDEVHGHLDRHHVLRDAGGWLVLVDGWTVLDPDGTLNCNPTYCAPEVFSKHVLIPASDLYAVGLLAFEARFGYRPFDGENVTEEMTAKLIGRAPTWRGPVAPEERDLFALLLAREPHQRHNLSFCLARIYDQHPQLRGA
jgi:FHA domain